MFVEKKIGHSFECSYRGKVERDEIKEQVTQSLLTITRSPYSILLTMGSHQKIAATRETCSGYHFRTICLDALLWADSSDCDLKGASLGRGHGSCPGGRWLDWIRVLAVERLRIVSKLLLKFISSSNFHNSKIDLASACLSKTFISLRAKLNCKNISQNICLEYKVKTLLAVVN